jgi:beta-glucosidase-like glycosyl hydrolase
MEELEDKDLVPFEQYAQAEYPRALMMAHMALPNVDPSGMPSTYSTVLIQDKLRDKLKYDGLIITDDLEMSGAAVGMEIGERAVRAFLAGNDMLMLAGTAQHQKQAYAAVLAAAKSGRIPEARLKKSVERILRYKGKVALAPFNYDAKVSHESVAAVEGLSRQVLQKVFHQALEGVAWPKTAAFERALILGSDPKFFEAFKKSYSGKADFFHLTPASLKYVGAEIAKEKYDIAVYYASGSQTAHWLAKLSAEQRSKTIVVNAVEDAEVDTQSAFMTVLNINTFCPDCGTELGETLSNPERRTPAAAKAEAKPTPEN